MAGSNPAQLPATQTLRRSASDTESVPTSRSILSARFTAVPEDEFARLELARRAGIAVPDNRLVEMSEIKGLPEEGRAAAAWNGLEQADLLPKDQRASVGKQILRVAARVK